MKRCTSRQLVRVFSFVTIFVFCAVPLVSADRPEGRGQGSNQGQGNNDNQGNNGNQDNQGNNRQAAAKNQGNGNSGTAAQSRGNSATARSEATRASNNARVDRQQRSNRDRADRGAGLDNRSQQAQRPSQARGNGNRDVARGRDAAREHVGNLLKSLNKLEKARWSHNPHDDRGQGNMGKVDMLDPYGFDKDSDREGKDRGRPIRESEEDTFNLADLVTIEAIDPHLSYLQEMIEYYEYLIELYAEWYPWYATYLGSYIDVMQNEIDSHVSDPDAIFQTVLYYGDSVDYSLSFDAFEGMDTSTFEVTTQLVSTETVTVTGWAPDENGIWRSFTTTYEEGEVLLDQTEDLALSEGGDFTLSFDPSEEILNGGYFNGNEGVTTDVVVTITDPESGQSFTMTLDQQYRLVDPYGIVYDKTLGTPVAGAVVTIHKANGSIVMLDKSANPNISNPQQTDATGRYSCMLTSGKYYLTVKAPGYEDYQSALFSEQGHIVREDVALVPLQLSVPTPSAIKALSLPVTHEGLGGSMAPLPGGGVGSIPLPIR